MILGIDVWRYDAIAAEDWARGHVVRVFKAPAMWLKMLPDRCMTHTADITVPDFPGTLARVRAVLGDDLGTWRFDWPALAADEKGALDRVGGFMVMPWERAGNLIWHKERGYRLGTVMDLLDADAAGGFPGNDDAKQAGSGG